MLDGYRKLNKRVFKYHCLLYDCRYDASTVLTLLQEVASHPNWKMNWKELVEKTSTGISSAKEYQMLWRHLAYGHPLIHEEFEDGAPPLVCTSFKNHLFSLSFLLVFSNPVDFFGSNNSTTKA